MMRRLLRSLQRLLAPRPHPGGHRAQCHLCEQESGLWPTVIDAQDAAVWHVYEQHPEEWLRVVGHRPPVNKDPRKAAR